MPQIQDKEDDVNPAPSPKVVMLMFATLADTTARLFVPTIGGTILGIWADHSFNTTPFLTIFGVLLGTALASMLVYLQIQKVKK